MVKKSLFFALVALAAACGSGTVGLEGSAISESDGGSNQESIESVVVPDVMGQTLEFAKGSALAVGLVISSEQSEKDGIEAGVIIGQVPVAGSQVPPGSPLVVWVSKEKPKIMPTEPSPVPEPELTTTTQEGVEGPEESEIFEEEVLTAIYHWGQSEEAKDLQSLLGLEADGFYGEKTREAHLKELEKRGFDVTVASPPTTSTVASPPTTSYVSAPPASLPDWTVRGCTLTWWDHPLNEDGFAEVATPTVLFSLNTEGDLPEDLGLRVELLGRIYMYPSGDPNEGFGIDSTFLTESFTNIPLGVQGFWHLGGEATVDAYVDVEVFLNGLLTSESVSCSVSNSPIFSNP